ncbi:MAG TPA: hypothetical protein VGR57_10995 [Ktedonobacterales bacterium]|nr:hypothetical protein [Ktedonobacterales bacterium]
MRHHQGYFPTAPARLAVSVQHTKQAQGVGPTRDGDYHIPDAREQVVPFDEIVHMDSMSA